VRGRKKQDRDVYFVSSDALGEPVKDARLDRLIDDWKKRSDEATTHVDFAQFVDFSDGLINLLGGQGRGIFGGQGHGRHRPPPSKGTGRTRK
jgi:hypothetical protein